MEGNDLNDLLKKLMSSKKVNSDTHVGWNCHTTKYILEIQIGESSSDAKDQAAQDVSSTNSVTEILAEAGNSSIKLNNGDVWTITDKGVCKDQIVVLPQRNNANQELVHSSLFIDKAYASAVYKSAASNEATFSQVNWQTQCSLITFSFDHESDQKFEQHAIRSIPGFGDLVICSSSWNVFFWLVNGAASSEVASVELIKCNKSVDAQRVENAKLAVTENLLTFTRTEDLVNEI